MFSSHGKNFSCIKFRNTYCADESLTSDLFAISQERKSSFLSFDPCSEKLASGSSDGLLSIWDLEGEIVLVSTKLLQVPLYLSWNQEDPFSLFVTTEKAFHIWNFPNFSADESTLSEVLNFHKVPNLTRHSEFSCFDSHKNLNLFCFGFSSGELLLLDYKSSKKEVFFKNLKKDVFVSEVKLDPLSDHFLLVCWNFSELVLFDYREKVQILKFNPVESRPSDTETRMSFSNFGEKKKHFLKQGEISKLLFLETQPGIFLSSGNSSLLRQWVVASPSPLKTLKTNLEGVQIQNLFEIYRKNQISQMECTSSNDIILQLANGAFHFMDIPSPQTTSKTSKSLNLIAPRLPGSGHQETIFDLSFHPSDPDKIATCSFDGTVKIWRLSSGVPFQSLDDPCGEILYAVCFSPEELGWVLASTAKGRLLAWSLGTGSLVYVSHLHSPQPCFRLSCKPLSLKTGLEEKPQQFLLASGGGDGTVCVWDIVEQQILRRLLHPTSAVCGVWSNLSLLTSCADGVIRVWKYSSNLSYDGAMEGHSARVFNLEVHPLYPSILASGSDDCSVRVWDVQSKALLIPPLQGHSSAVRALCWHPEVPQLLISGSWDSSIIAWDCAPPGKQVFKVQSHLADVYAFRIHPKRPFVGVSCSRDTSVRVWALDALALPYFLKVLVAPKEALSFSCNNSEFSFADVPKNKLLGIESAPLIQLFRKAFSAEKVDFWGLFDFYQKWVHFLYFRGGIDQSFSVLARSFGDFSIKYSPVLGAKVLHPADLPSTVSAKANLLAGSTSQVGLVPLKKDEKFFLASDYFLKIGEVEQSCKFLILSGNYERALSLAPMKGLQFYKKVAQEIVLSKLEAHNRMDRSLIKALLQNPETFDKKLHFDLEDLLPYLLAAGEMNFLTHFMAKKGGFSGEQALWLAHAQSKSKYSHLEEGEVRRSLHDSTAKTPGPQGSLENNLQKTGRIAAASFLKGGDVYSTASSYLAVDQPEFAVLTLLENHEEPFAFLLLKLFIEKRVSIPKVEAFAELAVKRLATYAELLFDFDSAIELFEFFEKLEPEDDARKQFCFQKKALFLSERKKVSENSSLVDFAELSSSLGDAPLKKISTFLGSKDFENATAVAWQVLKRSWSADQAWDMELAVEILEKSWIVMEHRVELCSSFAPRSFRSVSRLASHQIRAEVVCLSYLLALLKAKFRKQLLSFFNVPKEEEKKDSFSPEKTIFSNLVFLVRKENLESKLPASLSDIQDMVFSLPYFPSTSCGGSLPSKNENSISGEGACLSISGKKIKGNCVRLDDSISSMSLTELLGWTDLTKTRFGGTTDRRSQTSCVQSSDLIRLASVIMSLSQTSAKEDLGELGWHKSRIPKEEGAKRDAAERGEGMESRQVEVNDDPSGLPPTSDCPSPVLRQLSSCSGKVHEIAEELDQFWKKRSSTKKPMAGAQESHARLTLREAAPQGTGQDRKTAEVIRPCPPLQTPPCLFSTAGAKRSLPHPTFHSTPPFPPPRPLFLGVASSLPPPLPLRQAFEQGMGLTKDRGR